MLQQTIRFFTALIIVVSIANEVLAQDADTTTQTGPNVEDGQFIVKFSESGMKINDVADFFGKFDVKILDTLPPADVYHIILSEIPTTDKLIEWNNNPVIEYIEPVYKYDALLEPNDPYYHKQWGFEQIKAPIAWDRRTGRHAIRVAVIDSGVDYTHHDLSDNMWRNYLEIPNNRKDDDGNGIIDDYFGADFAFTGSVGGDPMDSDGHGTHVAGIIGAVSDNYLGVAGTAWEITIMAIRYLKNGTGLTVNSGRAIYYAIDRHADIINASFGGGGKSRYVEDAIKAANKAGILFVAAAGNNNSDNDKFPHFPASYEVPNVISIMASDKKNRRASFSNYGKNTVDIAAPGRSVYSTIPGNKYSYKSGTSMAAPYVAGAAAILMTVSEAYQWSPATIKEHLIRTSDRLWYCSPPEECLLPDAPNKYICVLDLNKATLPKEYYPLEPCKI